MARALSSGIRRWLHRLCRDAAGQDLVEYTLLIAFLALASTALFMGSGQTTSQVWSSANSILTTAANGSSPGTGGSGGGGGGGGGEGGGHHGHD